MEATQRGDERTQTPLRHLRGPLCSRGREELPESHLGTLLDQAIPLPPQMVSALLALFLSALWLILLPADSAAECSGIQVKTDAAPLRGHKSRLLHSLVTREAKTFCFWLPATALAEAALLQKHGASTAAGWCGRPDGTRRLRADPFSEAAHMRGSAHGRPAREAKVREAVEVVAASSAGGGGGFGGPSSAEAPTATRGLGGTLQRGDEVKPARPGNLGIAEGTSFGLGGAGSEVAGAGVATGGGIGGRATSGAEVKPQGFRLSGSVWRSRAGAAVRGEVGEMGSGKWHRGADVKPAEGGGGGGGGATGTSGICSCTAYPLALLSLGLRNCAKQGCLVGRHLPEPLLLDAEGECDGLPWK